MATRRRGRPRKDESALARWEPPEGWVRVVAWVSPEDRMALKRFALEADASVAELIRALGRGLDRGVITTEELLRQVKRGLSVMEKIPTIFERGEGFKVVDKPRESCAWVFSGEGMPTEKLDGTNIRLTIRAGQVVRVEKRRNPTRAQKQQGIVDGWYIDAPVEDPTNRWIYEAVGGTDVSAWPDGEHSCEALGPKIQGNALGLASHICVPFNLEGEVPIFKQVPRTFEGLRGYLSERESLFVPGHMAEGIVFHHPDGRRAKIKRKDFGR